MNCLYFFAAIGAIAVVYGEGCTKDEVMGLKTCVGASAEDKMAKMKAFRALKSKLMGEVKDVLQESMDKVVKCFPDKKEAGPLCKPPKFLKEKLDAVGGSDPEPPAGPLPAGLPPIGMLPPLGKLPKNKKSSSSSSSSSGSRSKGKMSKSKLFKKMIKNGVNAEQLSCLMLNVVNKKLQKCKMPEAGDWLSEVMQEKIQNKIDNFQAGGDNSSSSEEDEDDLPRGMRKHVKMLMKDGGVDMVQDMMGNMFDAMCGDKAAEMKKCVEPIADDLRNKIADVKEAKEAMKSKRCEKFDECKAKLTDGCLNELDNLCDCCEQTRCDPPPPFPEMKSVAKSCGIDKMPLPFEHKRPKREALALQRAVRHAHKRGYDHKKPFFCKCRDNDDEADLPEVPPPVEA